MMRRGIVLIALIVSSGLLCRADGGFSPPLATGRAGAQGGVSSPHQRGVIIEGEDGHEILLLQTTYRGPAADFAWIIPVPGRPGPTDVFMVGEKVIPYILEETAPHVSSYLGVERPLSLGVFAGRAGEKGGGGGSGVVSVHARMEVGDYDAVVLSATEAGGLVEWLADNGYRLPDGGEWIIHRYVDKQWYFVALKVLPKVVAERPVMSDVRPVGIRFPTDRLVYPLYISRLSSPEKTALLLVALAEDALRCDQLGWAPLPVDRRLPLGSAYAVIRRRAVERTPSSAVLEKEVGSISVPTDRRGLEDDSWIYEYPEDTPEEVIGYSGRYSRVSQSQGPLAAQVELSQLHVTRLWTILDRDEMEDLTFTPASGTRGPDTRIVRTAAAGGTFARSPLAVLLAALVFLIAAVLQAGRRPLPAWLVRIEFVVGAFLFLFPGMWMLIAIGVLFVLVSSGWWAGNRPTDEVREHVVALERTPLPALDRTRLLAWTLLAGGFVAWAIALTTASPAPSFDPSTVGLAFTRACYAVDGVFPVWMLWMLASAAWVVAVYLFVTDAKRDWPRPAIRASREVFGILVFGYCASILLMAVPGVADLHLHMNLTPVDKLYGWPALVVTLACALAYVSMLAFGAVAPYATSRSRAIAQAMGHAVAIAGLLVAGSGFHLLVPAYAGYSHADREVSGQLSAALESLDGAIESFREDTGCYPATLDDLTSPTPPAVGFDASGNEVTLGGGWNGPYLGILPLDPLTRRRDAWVYEVTGEPMVSSGGWRIVIRD
jgi:hypothetical protein